MTIEFITVKTEWEVLIFADEEPPMLTSENIVVKYLAKAQPQNGSLN